MTPSRTGVETSVDRCFQSIHILIQHADIRGEILLLSLEYFFPVYNNTSIVAGVGDIFGVLKHVATVSTGDWKPMKNHALTLLCLSPVLLLPSNFSLNIKILEETLKRNGLHVPSTQNDLDRILLRETRSDLDMILDYADSLCMTLLDDDHSIYAGVLNHITHILEGRPGIIMQISRNRFITCVNKFSNLNMYTREYSSGRRKILDKRNPKLELNLNLKAIPEKNLVALLSNPVRKCDTQEQFKDLVEAIYDELME